MSATRRIAGIDLLKAAAIVTVIFIHCFNSWYNGSSYRAFLKYNATSFAVPAFFVAAGFLTVHRRSQFGRQARRVLLPYLVASLLALASRTWLPLDIATTGPPPTMADLWWDLATGNAFGIYYFVFVLLSVTAIGNVVARAPKATRLVVLGAALAAGGLAAAQFFQLSFFWSLRSPIPWLSFYLLGSEVAATLKERTLNTRIAAFGSAVLVVLLFGGAAVVGPGPSASVAIYLFDHCLALAILFGGWNWDASGPAQWLSEASYTIYLYHLFIVAALFPITGYTENGRIVAFFVTLVGSILFTLTVRRVFGARAQQIFG